MSSREEEEEEGRGGRVGKGVVAYR